MRMRRNLSTVVVVVLIYLGLGTAIAANQPDRPKPVTVNLTFTTAAGRVSEPVVASPPPDFTPAMWQTAAGRGVYTVAGDNAYLRLEFEDLAPNSLYSVWCAQITRSGEPTFASQPCGAADGSDNRLITGPDGSGRFEQDTAALPASSDAVQPAILLVYHAGAEDLDRIQFGFAQAGHVQALAFIPPPAVVRQ